MVKTLCDVCSNEIKDVRKNWGLSMTSAVGENNLYRYENNYTICLNDVCEDCANTIYHYIKGLQKED